MNNMREYQRCIRPLKKLREIRVKLGVKQVQLAEILNCSIQFYSQIERGINTLNYENAVKLADYFGTTPDELFFEEFKWAKIKKWHS